MISLGLTVSEVAKVMDVSVSTLYKWGDEFPDFSEAIKLGREVCDSRIEQTLYERAAAGETGPMVFWLKNRKPNTWRDKKDVVVEDPQADRRENDVRTLGLATLALLQEAQRAPVDVTPVVDIVVEDDEEDFDIE